jgi:hypothetical protein
MRTKVKMVLPEMVLARTLEAFGQELVDASDEEIIEAAKELGMNLDMKASAAFLGLTSPTKSQVWDFFDVEAIKQHLAREARARIVTAPSDTHTGPKAPRSTLPDTKSDREDSGKK